MRTAVWALFRAALLTAMLAVYAHAGEPRFGDKLTFSIGAMSHGGDGFVVSTRPDLPIDRVTFKDLDLDDDEDIFWASLNWRFTNRWQLGLSYSSFDSDGLTEATASGNYDGIEWEVDAVLSSNLDVEFYILDFSYDFLQTERGHLGVGLGVHMADFEFDIEVGAFVSGAGRDFDFEATAAEGSRVFAPMPNISLGGGYMLTDKVYVDGRIGWLSLDYDNYEGNLTTLRVSAEWRAWERTGIGVGYQFIDIDVDRKGSRGRDTFDLEFKGPILFMSVGFQ